ncbi:MAG: Gldg family protein [Gemmatimonadetes bacterium]|nr:Gldg family protein [Gemmatimonadota bacterium]MDA1103437.1 Gldg family protein [Gemmatimonadota bacterium]
MTTRVFTVARRELRGYFDQPTAYVLIVAFLGLSLFLAFRMMYGASIASLRPIFDLLPVLFAVFIPAATMRTLAEERRGKTLDWLLAQPVTELELVLGKFLGVWAFVLLALAGTLPTAIGVLLVSQADPGIVLAQYVGAALLSAQLTAVGVWSSSFTRNQITAFIVAAAMSFTLFLIGLPIVQIGLPPSWAGLLARLSVVGHFENVARGVIDLRDVLYFISTAGLFLVLALQAIARERLSRVRPEHRRLRWGTGVVVVLVIVLNLLGSRVRGRLDLTADNLYTLSSGTKDLLRDLDDLVQIKLFASSELPPEVQLQLRDVRDLLADMRRASNGNLLVSDVDPERDPDAATEAAAMGIYPVEFNVLREDNFEVRQGYYGFAVVYAEDIEVTPLIQRTDDLEFRLASQIHRMTTEERPGIAFVGGFGAKGSNDIPGLREGLADRYQLRTIDIAGDSAEDIGRDSTEVLVIAGPMQPLDPAAQARVRAFMDGGGAVLVLAEPIMLNAQSPVPTPISSGLEDLLAARGITFVPGLVVDLASSERVSLGRQGLFSVIAPYPLWPIVVPAGDHSVTNGINSLTLGWAAPLAIDPGATGVTALWQTSENGAVHPRAAPISPDQDWVYTEEELGVRVVAASVLPGAGDASGRLIVVGDASLAEAQYLGANPGNLVFLANAIDWLARDEALINIRSKDRTPPGLSFSSDMTRDLLKWGNLLGVPLLFVLVGFVRITGRRRRAEARWREVLP